MMECWGVHCPECGRFCSGVVATINGLGEVMKVEGRCKKHGLVDLTDSDWAFEDFEDPWEGEK